MRIDVHTHIFTLRAILNSEALQVMLERLRHMQCPKPLVDAIQGLLEDLLDRPEYLDERTLLRKLIKKLTGTDRLGDIVNKHLPRGAFSVELEGDLDDLALGVLQDIITKFVDAHPAGGKVEVALNIVEALRQAMRPTITDVADDILAYLGDDGVTVALMMDIFAPPGTPRDEITYRYHIQGTAEAALQRPGRILPFFGVHPDRPGHFEALKDAVMTKGFVGVKLYPSLGYRVDSDLMRTVYRFCEDEELPVLLHCGHGGFYRTDEARNLCDPDQWARVLEDFPTMRVCFAHFGGWKSLAREQCFNSDNWDPAEDGDPVKDNWAKKIYTLLKDPTKKQVFTDLAKHVDMFNDAADRQKYFDTMRRLLADPDIGNRILYGSDAWLLRLDMPYVEYWREWKAGAGAALDAISVDGPRAFLGFPKSDGDPLPKNLARYVELMRANRTKVGDTPAAWLRNRIAEPFSLDRDPPDWDFTKQAVSDTYQFLGKFLSKGQKDRGYRANRTVRLNELRYFDRNDPNFGGRCRDMARRFVDFADGKGTKENYQPGQSFGAAVDLFIDIFRKGEMRLCDVAMVLDSVIAYPETIA